MYSKNQINTLVEKHPILEDLIELKPVTWLNSFKGSPEKLPDFGMGLKTMREAENLWQRFAPFFEESFPETRKNQGKIESPLKEIPKMKSLLDKEGQKIDGQLFLKCDNALPIVGSIKARGGFYEVLDYAEKLASRAGLIDKNKDYNQFCSEEFQSFFSQYTIGVGSTGNLGLSIGTISAKLGFKVQVFVSDDAKTWKKELLRNRGVQVIESSGDVTKAIWRGRKKIQEDPKGYFVDDENSKALYTGYTVGALRLARQLEEQNITVNSDHPLFVYLPCGVGGSPGGITFGLKQIFGQHVHCFFVEPTHSPGVLTGMVSGEMSQISVQDIGIDNKTEADGLAVGRPSKFATEISRELISGIYTIEDQQLFTLLTQLMDSEGIFLEPSATAGLVGAQRIAQSGYFERHNLKMKNATHLAWATGGDLVPDTERKAFYEKGSCPV